jgi:hypothetical protein
MYSCPYHWAPPVLLHGIPESRDSVGLGYDPRATEDGYFPSSTLKISATLLQNTVATEDGYFPSSNLILELQSTDIFRLPRATEDSNIQNKRSASK